MKGKRATWEERTTIGMRNVAASIAAALAELFGRPILSVRAIIVALALALSSMLLLSFAFSLYTWTSMNVRAVSSVRALFFLIGGVVALTAAVHAKRKYDNFTRATITLSLLAIMALFFGATSGHVGGFLLGFTLGGLSGLVVVGVTRVLAGVLISTRWPVSAALLAVANALIGVGLLIAPILAMNTGRMRGLAADILGFAVLTNAFAGIVAASFALVPAALLLQKLTWPVVHRPVYAMTRFNVFNYRKRIFSAGCILLLFGLPQLTGWVDSVVALFLR